MSTETEIIHINVDSRNRDSNVYPTSTKFSLLLADTIKCISSIKIVNIEIPNKMFKVLYTDTELWIRLRSNTIIIPTGQYSINDILYLIQNNLSDINVNICYDNKISFTSSTPFDLQLCNNKLALFLGFYNLSYSSLQDSYNIYKIYNDSVCTNLEHSYIFLKINNYGYVYNSNNTMLETTPLFSKLTINTDKANILANITYLMNQYYFRKPYNLSKLDIELLDGYGNLIRYDGDFSFTLEVAYYTTCNNY